MYTVGAISMHTRTDTIYLPTFNPLKDVFSEVMFIVWRLEKCVKLGIGRLWCKSILFGLLLPRLPVQVDLLVSDFRNSILEAEHAEVVQLERRSLSNGSIPMVWKI